MQESGGAGGRVLGREDSELKGSQIRGVWASSRKGRAGDGIEDEAGWNYQRLRRS